jgi:hypothetical protein
VIPSREEEEGRTLALLQWAAAVAEGSLARGAVDNPTIEEAQNGVHLFLQCMMILF